MVKPPTPSWAIDEFIKDEKQKKETAGPQPSYPETFGHLLRCAGII